MYYRIAIQVEPSPAWQWRSTVLSSLDTVFHWLWLNHALSYDRLRVFSSSSREEMNEQLMRENHVLGSNSVLATQFLQERGICLHEGGQEAQGQREHQAGGNQEIVSRAIVTHASFNEGREAQTLHEKSMSSLERRRQELERGTGSDHDSPYTFTLPSYTPQMRAWIGLLAKVQHGEIAP